MTSHMSESGAPGQLSRPNGSTFPFNLNNWSRAIAITFDGTAAEILYANLIKTPDFARSLSSAARPRPTESSVNSVFT